MKETTIGYVKEVTFSENPANSPITLLPIQNTSIESKVERVLTLNARFDCPCCGKGVQINIDTEI